MKLKLHITLNSFLLVAVFPLKHFTFVGMLATIQWSISIMIDDDDDGDDYVLNWLRVLFVILGNQISTFFLMDEGTTSTISVKIFAY
uniref:Uncharacterized protein n=1 Tax=Cannabis sativa TaxID=3483 RepID=A0A803R8S7_CANSA